MNRGAGDYAVPDQSIEVIDVGAPPAHVPARSSSLPKILAAVSGVLVLLYLCSPIDLIPEAALPLIGFVDDLLVFAGGLAIVGILLLAIRTQERKRQEVLHQQVHALRQQEQMQRLIDVRLAVLAAQLQQDPSIGSRQALSPPQNAAEPSEPRDWD